MLGVNTPTDCLRAQGMTETSDLWCMSQREGRGKREKAKKQEEKWGKGKKAACSVRKFLNCQEGY